MRIRNLTEKLVKDLMKRRNIEIRQVFSENESFIGFHKGTVSIYISFDGGNHVTHVTLTDFKVQARTEYKKEGIQPAILSLIERLLTGIQNSRK